MATKLKQVSFNIESEDEKNLIDAINESEFNFTHETKKMWAKLLQINYTQKKPGQKKDKQWIK